MDTTMPTHTPMRPKTIAELLPGIKALLSKNTVAMLTSKKKTISNTHHTRTNVKNMKPMTIAEIRALGGPTPRNFPQPTTSTKVKAWNSSVKVDKTIPLTKDGKMNHSTARKVLNFQPKPPAINRATMIAALPRKSIHPKVKAPLNRISGVCKIPETPVLTQQFPHRVAKIKMSNISFKSNGDDSFLQREKEINDFEEKSNALTEEPTLEEIADISPPISTPFKDYRNVRDYFNNSEAENSVLWNDNTIMSFEKPSEIKDSTTRDESVIVSLCDMLNKATVTNANNQEHGDLIEVERQAVNNLKMIDNVIVMLNSMKEKQLKSLQYIRKLEHDKLKTNVAKECNVTVRENANIATAMAQNSHATSMPKESKATLTPTKEVITQVKEEKVSPERSPITSRPTVIKSRSPSYKIPRRSICLRKKVFYQSMPNDLDETQTPNKNSDKALKMYMQIKEQMSFLNTPLRKPRTEIPDTPALTSHNLQNQLDKLYN